MKNIEILLDGKSITTVGGNNIKAVQIKISATEETDAFLLIQGTNLSELLTLYNSTLKSPHELTIKFCEPGNTTSVKPNSTIEDYDYSSVDRLLDEASKECPPKKS